MDAEKIGVFIHNCRKELGMTQSELAQKLNVTDKAISRWERGVGFPDIKLLEPLAETLHVTVLELMRGERMDSKQVAKDMVDEAITDTLKIANTSWFDKYRFALATVSVIIYLLFWDMTRLPIFAQQLNWMIPLERILFLVIVGILLRAAYRRTGYGS